MGTLCQTCGATGYSELLVSCRECEIYAVHRYCMEKIPSRDEVEVHWLCVQCRPRSLKFVSLNKLSLDQRRINNERKRKHKQMNDADDNQRMEIQNHPRVDINCDKRCSSGMELGLPIVCNDDPLHKEVGRNSESRRKPCKEGKSTRNRRKLILSDVSISGEAAQDDQFHQDVLVCNDGPLQKEVGRNDESPRKYCEEGKSMRIRRKLILSDVSISGEEDQDDQYRQDVLDKTSKELDGHLLVPKLSGHAHDSFNNVGSLHKEVDSAVQSPKKCCAEKSGRKKRNLGLPIVCNGDPLHKEVGRNSESRRKPCKEGKSMRNRRKLILSDVSISGEEAQDDQSHQDVLVCNDGPLQNEVGRNDDSPRKYCEEGKSMRIRRKMILSDVSKSGEEDQDDQYHQDVLEKTTKELDGHLLVPKLSGHAHDSFNNAGSLRKEVDSAVQSPKKCCSEKKSGRKKRNLILADVDLSGKEAQPDHFHQDDLKNKVQLGEPFFVSKSAVLARDSPRSMPEKKMNMSKQTSVPTCVAQLNISGHRKSSDKYDEVVRSNYFHQDVVNESTMPLNQPLLVSRSLVPYCDSPNSFLEKEMNMLQLASVDAAHSHQEMELVEICDSQLDISCHQESVHQLDKEAQSDHFHQVILNRSTVELKESSLDSQSPVPSRDSPNSIPDKDMNMLQLVCFDAAHSQEMGLVKMLETQLDISYDQESTNQLDKEAQSDHFHQDVLNRSTVQLQEPSLDSQSPVPSRDSPNSIPEKGMNMLQLVCFDAVNPKESGLVEMVHTQLEISYHRESTDQLDKEAQSDHFHQDVLNRCTVSRDFLNHMPEKDMNMLQLACFDAAHPKDTGLVEMFDAPLDISYHPESTDQLDKEAPSDHFYQDVLNNTVQLKEPLLLSKLSVPSRDSPNRIPEKDMNMRQLVSVGAAHPQQMGYTETCDAELNMSCHQTSIERQSVYVPARPIIHHIWRGCFKICNEEYGPLTAHLSSRVCKKVWELAEMLPLVLHMEKLSRLDAWPNSFTLSPPSGDTVALYFFPEGERAKLFLNQLLNDVVKEDLVLKVLLDEVELLVFSSMILPENCHRFLGSYYPWGVFRRRKASPPRPIVLAKGAQKMVEEKQELGEPLRCRKASPPRRKELPNGGLKKMEEAKKQVGAESRTVIAPDNGNVVLQRRKASPPRPSKFTKDGGKKMGKDKEEVGEAHNTGRTGIVPDNGNGLFRRRKASPPRPSKVTKDGEKMEKDNEEVVEGKKECIDVVPGNNNSVSLPPSKLVCEAEVEKRTDLDHSKLEAVESHDSEFSLEGRSPEDEVVSPPFKLFGTQLVPTLDSPLELAKGGLEQREEREEEREEEEGFHSEKRESQYFHVSGIDVESDDECLDLFPMRAEDLAIRARVGDAVEELRLDLALSSST